MSLFIFSTVFDFFYIFHCICIFVYFCYLQRIQLSWMVSRPTTIVFVFVFIFSTVFVFFYFAVCKGLELVEWYPGQPAARHCSQPASSPLTCRRAKPFLLLMLLLLVLLLSLLCLLWCFFTDIKLTNTYFLHWTVSHQTIVFRLQPTVPFELLILLMLFQVSFSCFVFFVHSN